MECTVDRFLDDSGPAGDYLSEGFGVKAPTRGVDYGRSAFLGRIPK
jgi:hypothetical protein